MAIYEKNVPVGGKWAKASELSGVKRAKIVSETNPMPSSFTNKDGSPKTQDVCKVQFEGQAEPLNLSLNRPTINALVDAFGKDSKNWQGHYLGVETEKVKVAGKSVTALYLVPEGYEKVDDAQGYTVVTKKGATPEEVPVVDLDEEEKIELPF